MMDVGLLELLVFFVPVGLAALAVYWIIRLAVRHGTLDAYRIDRVDRRIADMQAAERPQRATYGDSEPE